MTEEALVKENKEITKQYKKLLKISYRTLTKEDKKLIRSAFNLAVDAHKDQRRKSGEAYIFHPIAVAKIVASEIGLDATSIAAALLHDVVEDTSITIEDIEQLFGENVARIVDGLTKISHLSSDKDISQQAENFRKMLLTLNEDVRVIIIKIADQLASKAFNNPGSSVVPKYWSTLGISFCKSGLYLSERHPVTKTLSTVPSSFFFTYSRIVLILSSLALAINPQVLITTIFPSSS